MTIPPQKLVHRGVVEASGFVVSEALIGARAARLRILAEWRPGTVIRGIEDGFLVLQREAAQIRIDAAPGIPLVERGGLLSAAPLADKEIQKLDHPPRGIVLVRGGASVVEPLDLGTAIDPARWIDTSVFQEIPMCALGEPPPVATLVAVERPAVDLRAALGPKVPKPVKEVDQILRALREADPLTRAPQARAKAGPRPTTAKASPSLRELGAALSRFFGRVAEWLESLLSLPGSANTIKPAPRALGTGRPEKVAVAEPDERRKQRGRVRGALERFLLLLARRTVLGQVLGRRHAEYLAKMMDMFERGDLNDALRHAIPLGGDHVEPASLALGLPSPRNDLRISGGSGGQASFIRVAPRYFEELMRMYRRAFERLEREGRIEEAAFVLAELLHSTEEAVMFLERHGFLVLAAELAESRKLRSGLVVRQWFIAGNTERAVRIARRTGAFSDAVVLLEQRERDKAEALRLLWADTLAEVGDYAAAVDVLWPVESARHIVRPWIERAIAIGGVGGARMLVRSVVLDPETFPQIEAQADLLLGDDAFETLPLRLAFESALVGERNHQRAGGTDEMRVLARSAIRALVRDHAIWPEDVGQLDISRLTAVAKDDALRADLPGASRQSARPDRGGGAVELDRRGTTRLFAVERRDTGTLPIFDVALLPNGRFLVALGEAGVRLLTRDGRTAAHFAEPASRLVVSDHGDRVITAIERGPVAHLGRIDLLRSKATAWCEMAIQAAAPDFDGSLWFVAEQDRLGPEQELLALDATAKRREALWRLGAVKVLQIARSASRLSALIRDAEGTIECWSFDLPGLVLRGRTPILEGERALPLLPMQMSEAVSPDGTSAIIETDLDLDSLEERPPFELAGLRNGHRFRRSLSEIPRAGLIHTLALSDQWLALPFSTDLGTTVYVISMADLRLALRIDLEGATRATARLSGTTIAVADDRGRVLLFDRRYGRLLRSLRVR